jgi:hypothetical protein
MRSLIRQLHIVLLPAVLALLIPTAGYGQGFEEARIYIEYNETANDLGFHVSLDGEDWTDLKIFDPTGKKIFDVSAGGGYKNLGLTELFFEGAEPNLSEFPLEELLELFPEGEYRFIGKTVDNEHLESTAVLSHAVPDGPVVSSQAAPGGTIRITWQPVTGPAEILPGGSIDITGYQVIVGSFQVTVPASATGVTVPAEYYQSLPPGSHAFEVLAIDASGNQTITEGFFVKSS